MEKKNQKSTKPKAEKADVGGQLVVLSAHKKVFSSGKEGFFGKVLDPASGQRYQVIGAVAIAG